MNLEFKEITPDNWRKVISLEAKKEQKRFVAENVGVLARAFAYRKDNSKIHVLYSGDNPIGLIMQRDFFYKDEVNCILDQFMIDKNYQGQGYGRAAMESWISMIKDENKYNNIKLCYIKDDLVAEKMYKNLGFIRKLEEDDEDELVMAYKLYDRNSI